MMFVLLLIPAVLLGLRDLCPAVREGKRYYAIAYLALTTTALVLWMLLYRGVALTSPNTWIEQTIELFVAVQ